MEILCQIIDTLDVMLFCFNISMLLITIQIQFSQYIFHQANAFQISIIHYRKYGACNIMTFGCEANFGQQTASMRLQANSKFDYTNSKMNIQDVPQRMDSTIKNQTIKRRKLNRRCMIHAQYEHFCFVNLRLRMFENILLDNEFFMLLISDMSIFYSRLIAINYCSSSILSIHFTSEMVF